MKQIWNKDDAAQPLLRIGATMGVPEVLQSLGEDPATVLAEVGVKLSLFDDPGNRISYLERGRMVEHCAKRTACPYFGLLIGQKAGLHSFGFVGLLAKYSQDVGSALRSFVRFFDLHVRGAVASLTQDSNTAVFEYQIYQVGAQGNDQVGDGAVAVAFNILRELCGDRWQPLEVRFAHRQPENTEPYHQFFKVPLRFDTEQYGVVFAAGWLERALPGNDPGLRRLLQREVDKLEVQQGDNFLDRVRSILRTTVVTGHSSEEQVAELFSMHRCTLSRRLNALGTSFRKVVDEIRFEIARQLLEDSSMEIFQIAVLLGYSNASAFTRAFRRWSSTTPAQWRLAFTTVSVPAQIQSLSA